MKKHPLTIVVAVAVAAIGATLALSLLFQADGGDMRERREPARRIVSLMPPVTETLFEIGAGDQVVGRSDWCDHPPGVLSLPACGSALTPNIEKIVRLSPDLILANSGQGTARDKLRPLGDAAFLPWLQAEDAIASTRELGRLTGHVNEASKLADELEAALMVPRPKAGPRVLLVIGQDSDEKRVTYLRRNSLHGRMLNAAGGINAVEEDVTGVPTLSTERVIELDPDIVIVLDMRDDLSDAERGRILDFWRRLEPLKAVKENRTGVLNGRPFYGAGRRLIGAVQDLRAEIERLAPHDE